MLCPHCKSIFRNYGHPAYVTILRACHAQDKKGFVEFDSRNSYGNEVTKFLESKGYLTTTETGEYTMAYKAANCFFIDPGMYCWCHLHVDVKEG